MKKIIRQVTFEGANRRKDGSVKLSFTTDMEQSTPEFMELDEVRNTHGILYYSDRGELTQEEVDALDEVDIELEGKTKSQRLRSVLFVYWQQKYGNEHKNSLYHDFKDFYALEMERIIQHYKDKLD